jgi:serine protease Do
MGTFKPRPSRRARLSTRSIRPLTGAAFLLVLFSFPAAAAWLGVSVQDLTPSLAEAMELPKTSGVLVTDVVPGSPADRCGLHARDVIVKVGGTAVEHPSELVDLLSARAPGDRVAIQAWRGSSLIDVDAELEAPRTREPARTRPEDDRDRRIGPNREGRPGPAATGPQIGIDVYPLNEDLAHALRADRSEGVLVLQVRKESPAEKSGLRPGDILLRINDRGVQAPADIREALRSRDVDEDWTAVVVRDGRAVTLTGRIDPAWRSPGPQRSLRSPVLPDRGEMSVWTNRQWRRLDREMQELRNRIEDLERRLRRSEVR